MHKNECKQTCSILVYLFPLVFFFVNFPISNMISPNQLDGFFLCFFSCLLIGDNIEPISRITDMLFPISSFIFNGKYMNDTKDLLVKMILEYIRFVILKKSELLQ